MSETMTLRNGSWDELHLAGQARIKDGEVVNLPVFAIFDMKGTATIRRSLLEESNKKRNYKVKNREVEKETTVGILPKSLCDEWDQEQVVIVQDVGLDWPIWWHESVEDASKVIFGESPKESEEKAQI